MAKPALWKSRAIEQFELRPGRVYTRNSLAAVLRQHSAQMGTPPTLSLHRFIESLEEAGLRKVTISPAPDDVDRADTTEPYPGPYYREFIRYVWRDASAHEVALSLRVGSYLSHATAVFLHALTPQIPRIVYANKEQSAKPDSAGTLTQEAVDRAFRNKPRVSRYVFEFEQHRIVLLNGKQTGNLEVSEVADLTGRPLRCTKLERTLIDITVRANYSGGVYEVLEAFRGARERVSVPTLLVTLKKLGYMYPYHQAIGFYMERAGYSQSQLQRIMALGTPIEFYLTYQMPAPRLDQRWRVYHPDGL